MNKPTVKFENCESIADQIDALVGALDNTTCGEFILSCALKALCTGEKYNPRSTKIGGELTSTLYRKRQQLELIVAHVVETSGETKDQARARLLKESDAGRINLGPAAEVNKGGRL